MQHQVNDRQTNPPNTSSDRSPNTNQKGVPKLSIFRGDDLGNKTDVSFDQWLFEVKTVRGSYSERTVKEVIVKSLKGAAAELIHSLGPDADVDSMVKKLETVHGAIHMATFDVLMQNFYNLVQGKTE